MHVVTTWLQRDGFVATTLKSHVVTTWICVVPITWKQRGDVTLHFHITATLFSLFFLHYTILKHTFI